MTSYDKDVLRWNLHLLDVCSISNAGSPSSLTQYGQDQSQDERVREGYVEHPNVENDEVIAQALQEELSRLARQEASGTSPSGMEQLQESVLSQDWRSPSNRLYNNPNDGCESGYGEVRRLSAEHGEEDNELRNGISCYSPEEKSYREDLYISDESELDGEVEKRLNQMVPIPHVPKVNGELPSADEEVSDHQRLLDRLQLYDLVENRIKGDGNCQFRAISDQLYRSSEYHSFVRDEIVKQLKTHPEIYDGYVPMAYADYLKKMSKSGEWGDHVTLQAAADSYGVKIFVITSFKDTCYIEIIPHVQRSKRVIFLSFWAEVHYNSIYPLGELPAQETRKKKWWVF